MTLSWTSAETIAGTQAGKKIPLPTSLGHHRYKDPTPYYIPTAGLVHFPGDNDKPSSESSEEEAAVITSSTSTDAKLPVGVDSSDARIVTEAESSDTEIIVELQSKKIACGLCLSSCLSFVLHCKLMMLVLYLLTVTRV